MRSLLLFTNSCWNYSIYIRPCHWHSRIHPIGCSSRFSSPDPPKRNRNLRRLILDLTPWAPLSERSDDPTVQLLTEDHDFNQISITCGIFKTNYVLSSLRCTAPFLCNALMHVKITSIPGRSEMFQLSLHERGDLIASLRILKARMNLKNWVLNKYGTEHQKNRSISVLQLYTISYQTSRRKNVWNCREANAIRKRGEVE